jgi:hypothetical protein
MYVLGTINESYFVAQPIRKISSSMKSRNLKGNTKNNVSLWEFIWFKLRLLSSGK